MNKDALFKLEYGLYLLTTSYDNIDNGCIINTVMQLTDTPVQLAISVNNTELTHDLIKDSAVFNISCLTTDTPFQLIKDFGFQSGRDVNKFADMSLGVRSKNNVFYVPRYSNAFLSCHVIRRVDLGTHTLFIAEVTDAEILSDKPTLTYDYYHKNIKPKPNDQGTKGWRCKICNYVYEGNDIPEDFICPWCKHGISDFEPIA